MRGLDFSSWQGLLTTLAGLALITVIGVGIRLLVMQTPITVISASPASVVNRPCHELKSRPRMAGFLRVSGHYLTETRLATVRRSHQNVLRSTTSQLRGSPR